MKYLINIVGPTAIGKTSLSIKLANHYKTEIISADSRQFYKEMSIGTAKPTPEEQAQAVHHFIDFISINKEYSAGTFEEEVIEFLTEFYKKHDVAIMVGGSGLYVKAITHGIDDIPSDKNIREELNKRFQSEGLEPLKKQLHELDPIHYSKMDIENPQRVIRALEVCLATGKSYSSFRNNESKSRDFEIITIGLEAPRELIYERINKRVDIMMEEGLLDEVTSLLKYKNLNALNTVGYKELFQYLEGKCDLEEAIEEIKKHTRQFAKRQLTWFKKDEHVKWFDISKQSDIIPFVNNKMRK